VCLCFCRPRKITQEAIHGNNNNKNTLFMFLFASPEDPATFLVQTGDQRPIELQQPPELHL
jgi:hypothetical protein